tara:strand:- start:697 stop:804 length:108 start_codon:yes stop_codon:yes gene_type:complete
MYQKEFFAVDFKLANNQGFEGLFANTENTKAICNL